MKLRPQRTHWPITAPTIIAIKFTMTAMVGQPPSHINMPRPAAYGTLALILLIELDTALLTQFEQFGHFVVARSGAPVGRHRVHIRDSKGNRDRFVPLPQVTLGVLRRFWKTHHNPELLFPNRQGGLSGARNASTPLDRGGVQKTLHQVTIACGLKKRSPRTACATATPRT